MDYFSQLQSTVLSDLTIDSGSTLFPTATVKLAINRAYRKAGALFRWSELEDAKKTSTVASQEYYDYPDNWQPDSIWKLTIDDEDYGDPLVFRDYLFEKENTIPSGADYLWSSQWRRFFVYPTPTTSGSNNICVWGQKVVDSLSQDSDTTIFSYSMPECNEAIVLEAVAILKAKGEDTNSSQFRSAQAKEILAMAWSKIRQNQMKYEKTTPMFNIPDYFSQRGRRDTNIGNF